MRLRIEIDDRISQRLSEIADHRLTEARKQMVEDTLAETLNMTIQRNPVETARSRAAWVGSLEKLGHAAPPGWEGPSPTAVGEGRAQGQLTVYDGGDITDASASNTVSYVSYLEYGTRKMAPAAMVRSALSNVMRHVASFFRLMN